MEAVIDRDNAVTTLLTASTFQSYQEEFMYWPVLGANAVAVGYYQVGQRHPG